jgi:hypothetical protein
MLEIQDFFLDHLVLRQVKRQEEQAAAELEDDLEEDIDIVPATQRNKPRDIDSDAEDLLNDNHKRAVKQERMRRGPSRPRVASTPVSEDDDPEPIEMDD